MTLSLLCLFVWMKDTKKNCGFSCWSAILIPSSYCIYNKKKWFELTWSHRFPPGSHTLSFLPVSSGPSWGEGPHRFLPCCLWSDMNSQCTRPVTRIHKVKAKNQHFPFTKWQIHVSVGEGISGTQPKHLGKGLKKWTHCAIDEDPQMFSSDGLQLLSVVQLPKDHFVFQDVVLQDDLEQPLIHGHHFSCREKPHCVFTPCASQSKDRLTRQQFLSCKSLQILDDCCIWSPARGGGDLLVNALLRGASKVYSAFGLIAAERPNSDTMSPKVDWELPNSSITCLAKRTNTHKQC